MRLCRSSDAAYFACGTILTTARSVAAYGKTALTHEQVLQRYQGVTPSQADELALLETVEQRMRSWRLNKWEFRVPVLLTQAEKETAQQQLHKIKTLVLDHAKTQELIDADLNRVCTDLGVTKDELRTKNRAWLQEKVADLRWKGEVAQAKKIREAFVRLESYGSRDFRYFERLCCVYGLAKLGTFDDAFSNMVVPSGDSVALDTSSPFQDLMGLLVRKYASLDIIFDFLGFNDLEGYRAALGRHMRLSLEGKYRSSADGAAPTRTPKSRVLFQRNVGTADRELLYEFRNNAQSVASAGDASNGVADFVHVRGNDMTLITIASKNRWLRSRQVPHRKQLEGIGRRASFVLQIPLEQTRIRSLFLPPSYVDRASLDRIHSSVLGLRSEQVSALAPWTDLYTKELDVARDADYAEIARAKPEEEWVML